MDFSSITANSSASVSQALTTATTDSSLSMNADTFLKLFTTQIANQNPMDPMDSADFLNQFSQISQVQMMSEMQKSFTSFKGTLDAISSTSEQSRASEMLGRQVEYTATNGTVMNGTVDALSISSDGTVRLSVNGSAINVDQVRKVQDPPAQAPAA
jgi:flagellar basal-body rod modification protein FlgD